MVQYKFFKHTDTEGINKFLKETVIADGFSVFRFDDGILYPYEDGEGLSLIQKIINHKEEREKVNQKMDVLMFAQTVLQKQVVNIKDLIEKIETESERQIAELTEKINPGPNNQEIYEANKLIDEEIKEIKTTSGEKLKQLQNVLQQKESQVSMNDAQATEFVDEINMRTWVILELQSPGPDEGVVDAPEMFESKSEDGKIIVRGKSQEEADQLLKEHEEKRNKKEEGKDK